MHLLIGFAVIVILIVSSRSEDCNEGKLRECLTTLQILLEEEHGFVRRTEDELNEYCLKVQQKKGCLEEAASECQQEHQLISALGDTLVNHLNHVCGPGKDRFKIYMDMLSCIDNHNSDFNLCTTVNVSEKLKDEQLKEVCLDMKSILCVADTSRKLCDKNGKDFAKLLEYGLVESFSKNCEFGASGTTSLKLNIWNLLLSTCILLLFKYH